ncbi:sphingomyelin phosphodiesterase [Vararia minispora EC-137]|uniref:Sphingomyelin phosphodiesterase n=1 Tax=Vararia minispora EC-137 TaxID=1314806 RepID=A0ACB8Q8H4_9AGAM|nr:sphingomyelin phosphodiesterase [Vararia minispora EC-137]
MALLPVTMQFFALAAIAAAAGSNSSTASTGVGNSTLGPSNFTASGVFPASLFHAYYNNPTATDEQPQPVISDPVTRVVYPFSLTDPKNIPQVDVKDPHILPPKQSSDAILSAALAQISSIGQNAFFANSSCARCQAQLLAAKVVALAAPERGPDVAVALCETFQVSTTCNTTWGADALGSVITQVLAFADVGGFDGQMICQNFLRSACPLPGASPLNLTNWFAKPKPNPLPVPKRSSGKLLKVLHLSDFHLDPRYATGSEANCTSGLCCRANNHNSPAGSNTTALPAPRFGAYRCDTPYSLAAAALAAIPVLTATENTGFDFMVYTGDLVSHDTENQLSRDYVLYTETVVYDLFKRTLGSGPVYVALGNHDSYNQAQDAPHALGGELSSQFSWNYDHVASLWKEKGWISESVAQLARAHYAGYMVRRQDGLRIITLNTDLWYHANWFNFINMTQLDPSGMLRFLTDELQDAEDAGERVWIMGHVLSGWDGADPLVNPTNLFYQIVDRYSPHVIANIFWGHTHEDEHSIFYTNNATNISAETAVSQAWIAPSITPLTNLNSGFRMYLVDSGTFDIIDAHTWRSDVNAFSQLDGQTKFGPTYVYEYSTREAYGANITGWGASDPLNATWWHLVTEQMEANPDLITTFNTFQGKQSVLSTTCTGQCATARVCYMRSGSAAIAFQNCPSGFGSVQ